MSKAAVSTTTPTGNAATSKQAGASPSSSSTTTSSSTTSSSQPPIKLKKPVFVKIGDFEPEQKGVNVHAKVVEVKQVLEKTRIDGSRLLIAEALIGDSTGVITLTLRNEQIPIVVQGSTITVRNAKIEMFKGHMRLSVDQWGLIEKAAQQDQVKDNIKSDNNMSLVEYELVNVD